ARSYASFRQACRRNCYRTSHSLLAVNGMKGRSSEGIMTHRTVPVSETISTSSILRERASLPSVYWHREVYEDTTMYFMSVQPTGNPCLKHLRHLKGALDKN